MLPRVVAKSFSSSPGGAAKVQLTVVSSIFSPAGSSPATSSQPGLPGERSSLRTKSSSQKTMSSAVNGWPSDHFMPARRYMVMVRPSSENSQSRITFGMI